MIIPESSIKASQAQGINQVGTFGFMMDRQMFSLLSDQVYTRKEEAAIREICCNAADAHTDAGKGDIPIEVWAPTEKNPYFRVRDYGQGMSYETLCKRYPTYGWSDKREDETATGGFGLGAKAPLGYLSNFEDGEARPFIVESIHSGLRSVIMCAYDTKGLPGIHEILRNEPTTDRSGVTVSFEVDAKNLGKFLRAMRHVFLAFSVMPKFHDFEAPERIKGAHHNGIGFVNYGEHGSDYQSGPSLTLANVTYPVRNLTPANPLVNDWLCNRMNLTVATGPRIMAPSREALMETKFARELVEQWYVKEITAAYKAVVALIKPILEADGHTSMAICAARQALSGTTLKGLPFVAKGFVEFGGVAPQHAGLYQIVSSNEQITLALPEFLQERNTGFTLLYTKYEGNNPKVIKLSSAGTFAVKEKKRLRSETTHPPFCFKVMLEGGGAVYSPEIVIMQNGSAGRRVQSEMARRAEGLPGATKDSAMLCMRVKPQQMDEALALLERLKQEAGFKDMKVTYSDEFALLKRYEKESDAPKPKTVQPKSIRIPGEVMYVKGTSAKESYNWELKRVRLANGEEALSTGLLECFVDAKGASWRGGRATRFTATNFVSFPASGKEEILIRFNAEKDHYPETQSLACATKGLPGALMVTNNKLAAAVKEQGLPSLAQYLLDAVTQKIVAHPPELRKFAATVAALKHADEMHYSSKQFKWMKQFIAGSEQAKTLLAKVKNKDCKAKLKLAMPYMFKPTFSFTQEEVLTLADLIYQLNRFFRRHAYKEQLHTKMFDGENLHNTTDLLEPLVQFEQAAPHVVALYSAVNESCGISKADLLLIALNYKKTVNDDISGSAYGT